MEDRENTENQENVVQVNFKEKRPKAKPVRPGVNFFETKTAGIVVLGALIALGWAIHLVLVAP